MEGKLVRFPGICLKLIAKKITQCIYVALSAALFYEKIKYFFANNYPIANSPDTRPPCHLPLPPEDSLNLE